MREREPQCAGLVAADVVLVDEFEALAERAAMILDWTPERRIGRIVDDHDAFEVRIIESRDRVERGFEHLRRFAMGRNVDRYFRGKTLRCRQCGGNEPPRPAPERDDRDLLDACERDRDQGSEEKDTEPERESGRGDHHRGEDVGVRERGRAADAQRACEAETDHVATLERDRQSR